MAIQIRRGNDAEWESNKSNIVAGEPAVTLDSERMFVGTGSGTYMELANLDVLADAFDSSASYEVGDFVAYHGKVYKFNTDHSGAWNTSDVEEVALADALDSLGDDVYTKAEADALLALKANASDVNSALALKADKSDTYTKTEVNTALALKADKSDTYTKTEVDNALALKADADDVYTKTEADALLDKKANIDGYYEDMTVGNAEQLVTNLTDTESEPFTFRTSGGNLEIGDREELTVGGGSLPWNQIADYADSQLTTVDANGVLTISGTPTGNVPLLKRIDHISGHKYLYIFDVLANPNNVTFTLGMSQGTPWLSAIDSSKSGIYTSIYSTYFSMYNVAGVDLTGIKLRLQIHDLTQMFGTAIADYIYNLEQTTAGAGVAFFKKYFPKNYYPYNAGEMLHVQTSEFKTVGFNQWDEEWEVGNLDANGNPVAYASYFRTKNFIRVIPSAEYYFKTADSLYVWAYDENKNVIGSGYTFGNVVNTVKTMPSNCHYIKFVDVSRNSYNHDICINLHWDGTRDGEYEPYTEHSYPLDDSLELRGIPKLDADNNLYYNGDTYEHDGTVTRRYGIVDLGTLTWEKQQDGLYFCDFSGYNAINDMYGKNLVCSLYLGGDAYNRGGDRIIAVRVGTYQRLWVFDTSQTGTGSQFKSYVSGQYLVYGLNVPTTEEAEPYQSPQIVDNRGTEEFVVPTQSGVEIPVGHETVYPISLRDKLESAPNLPDGDGDYLLHMANGEATYKQLVSEFPSAPTTDGTYVLKATVSSGTATLTWVAE